MAERFAQHTFPIILDERSKIIILGSIPSVKSVECGFYYMHPRNRFWAMMSALLESGLQHATNDDKRRVLLENKIALYDVISCCTIVGSSDNKITDEQVADIPQIISQSNITHIFCNGAKAYSLLVKNHPDLQNITTLLPSTSPANAQFSLERLIDCWSVIKTYLDD